MWRPGDKAAKAAGGEGMRFVATGVAAAGLFGLLSFVGMRSGLPPFAATLAAHAITVVTSYAVQRNWTFGGRHHHRRAFPRYVAAQVACAAAAATLAQAAAHWTLSPAAVSASVTVFASAMSFCLSRYWVFPAARAP